jgi:hypothetical protein
MASVSAYTD